VVLVSVVADVMIYRALNVIAVGVDKNQTSFDLTLDVQTMRLASVEQQNAVRGFMASGDEQFVATYEKQKKALADMAQHFKDTTVSEEQRKRVDLLTASVANWQANSAERQIALARDPATKDQALALTGKLTLAEARGIVDQMIETQEALIEQRGRETDEADASAKTVLIAGGIAAALLAAAMGFVLSRSIATPVAAMTEAMRRLAGGDRTIDVPAADRKDEIGSMAAAVLTFKQAAVEQARLQEEAAVNRSAQEAQRDRQSAIDNSKAEDLKVFVHAVEEGFNALSEGNLTVRMNQAVAPEFEPIRAKFNESVEKLEDTIGSVVNAIGAIRVGLTQITVASADLSQRTEQQAASLEETVAALAEVTRGVNDTAGDAGNAQVAAVSATKNAEKGGAIVAQAVAAMSQIEESSEKIGKIIGVIDEIAFQTNLLALNAGVEAARAGEAGRGFAVVAQEVRGLAQRSAEAAKEIKDLISTSSAQVGLGVELVTNSGKSLQEIVEQVSNMSEIVSGIAASAKEQSLSLREVSMAADNMDKVTQQNAAMVEETTAAAQSLTAETEALAEMVEQFKTKTGTEPTRSSRPATKPRLATSSTPRAVAQMRTTGSGGAAARPARAPSAESWEEF
jgi:methyl-accepting chemotaxis protein